MDWRDEMCKTCIYWQGDTRTIGESFSGFCRRFPPSAPVEKGDVSEPQAGWWKAMDHYTRTHCFGVCAEWRAKDRA